MTGQTPKAYTGSSSNSRYLFYVPCSISFIRFCFCFFVVFPSFLDFDPAYELPPFYSCNFPVKLLGPLTRVAREIACFSPIALGSWLVARGPWSRLATNQSNHYQFQPKITITTPPLLLSSLTSCETFKPSYPFFN